MSRYNIISKREPHHPVSEQYRKLATSIDYSSINHKIQIVNFTSSFPEEGKTLSVLNLAMVYSQTKVKTLIIDLDLRKPKIHRAFEVSNTKGLCDFITGTEPIDGYIKNVEHNLDVITSGGKVPFPVEILNSNKLKETLEYLKTIYGRIILDCPPLTAVADATIVSNLADGTVFVVASRKTNRDSANDVLKQLKESGAHIIGGLMTQVAKRDVFYGTGYYYSYED